MTKTVTTAAAAPAARAALNREGTAPIPPEPIATPPTAVTAPPWQRPSGTVRNSGDRTSADIRQHSALGGRSGHGGLTRRARNRSCRATSRAYQPERHPCQEVVGSSGPGPLASLR